MEFTVEEICVQEGSFLYHGAQDDLWENNGTMRDGFYEGRVDEETVYYHTHPDSEDFPGRPFPASWYHKLDQVIRASDMNKRDLTIHCHKIVPGEFHYARFPVGLMITSGTVVSTGPTDMQYENGTHIDVILNETPFKYDPRISAKEADDLDEMYDASVSNPSHGDIVVLIEHNNITHPAYSRDKIEAFAKRHTKPIIEINNEGRIVG